MLEQNLFAGFGGQGMLTMGQFLALAGMSEGKYVTWLPSYGPEMRGGTANCSVVLSDKPISSPVITKATCVVVMNNPSFDKFESAVRPGGMLIVNSSLIDRRSTRTDIDVYYVPANEIAEGLGSAQVASIVILGAYVSKSGCVAMESVVASIAQKLGKKKAHLVGVNEKALAAGAEAVK